MIAAFIEGSLGPSESALVNAHMARCAACCAAVAAAGVGVASTSTPDTDPLAAMSTSWGHFTAPEPGEVLADKYVIERPIGQGGMGAVFAARHRELGHRVAIKVLFRCDDDNVARFLREARTCAQIGGENLIRVSDMGKLPNGSPYLVMEYLSGSDLAREIAAHPIPIADAVTYVLHACAGLAVAHAKGVVHRDLKPANLFLTKRDDGSPLVKVLDFGVSKLLHGGLQFDRSITRTQTLVGSPRYMSPEQLDDSRDVDVRTDVWSLGVILYELLTARAPFSASSMAILSMAILTAKPAAPSSLREGVPPGLDACILRCLEKRREDRYGTVSELAAALAPFAVRTPAMDPTVRPETRVARKSVMRMVPLAAATLAAAAVGAGLVVVFLSRGGFGHPEEHSSSTSEAPVPPVPSTPLVVPLVASALVVPSAAPAVDAGASAGSSRGAASSGHKQGGAPAPSPSATSKPEHSRAGAVLKADAAPQASAAAPIKDLARDPDLGSAD